MSSTGVDVAAYLRRTGCPATPSPTLATLRALQAAHLASIPFENIDVRLRRPIRLDLDSLQAKLIERRRGGYCFEQNTLFAAVLRELGFAVATLEARVRPPGATRTLPRTHMTLQVELDDRFWLTDVGFGGDGPVAPVPLDGEESEQSGERYRLVDERDGILALQIARGEDWRDLYAFHSRPALPIDFEVANHFTSTHPESIFLQTLTVQRTADAVRHVLRGLTYSERRGRQETVREIPLREVPQLLREQFRLELPSDELHEALGELGRPSASH